MCLAGKIPCVCSSSAGTWSDRCFSRRRWASPVSSFGDVVSVSAGNPPPPSPWRDRTSPRRSKENERPIAPRLKYRGAHPSVSAFLVVSFLFFFFAAVPVPVCVFTLGFNPSRKWMIPCYAQALPRSSYVTKTGKLSSEIFLSYLEPTVSSLGSGCPPECTHSNGYDVIRASACFIYIHIRTINYNSADKLPAIVSKTKRGFI